MKMMLKIFVVALIGFVSQVIVNAQPAVIWKSEPVNPGEAVMLFGGPWSTNCVIELSGGKNANIKPISVTDDCLTFIYPDSWPLSEFAAKVSDKSGNVSVDINVPDVWWIQGNAGKEASPGGWLRAFGRCIGYNDKAYIEFRGAENRKIFAKKHSLFDMMVEVPENIAVGEYDVFVNNGLGIKSVFAGRFKITPSSHPWKDRVFNVVDYGAIPNDRIDDSKAILAALSDLSDNGGGILYFPRGRFGMQGTLKLPPNSLLKGQDMVLSQLYWLDEDNPVGALISGKYNFGIKDIFLASGNILAGVDVIEPGKNDNWKNKNILLQNVRMRFLGTDANSKKEIWHRENQQGYAVHISGDFIRMINCDIYTSVGGVTLGGNYIVFSSNSLSSATCHFLSGKHAIIEGNNTEFGGISFGPESKDVIFRNNKIGYVYNNGDRETFTFDGGRAAYNSTAVSVFKQGMVLKPGVWRDSADAWIGESVLVFGGEGAGQHRYIKEINGRKVTIDKPWEIMPSTNSFFVIGKQRSKLLFIDNHSGDGNPFQLYGSATDVVLSGNKVERNSGMHAYGMTKGGSPEPSWFVQFLDNELLEGNSVRGPWSYIVPAEDGYIAFFDRGIKRTFPRYPESRVGIMRRNIIHNNGYFYAGQRVDNMLIENNLVKDSDKGIVAKSKGLIVRGNKFERVLHPYKVAESAVFSESEQLAANLKAIQTVLGEAPADWENYIIQAEKLREKKLSSADINQEIMQLREKAAISLSKHLGERAVDADIVNMLLGVDLSQSSEWQFTRLKPGKNTIVRIGNGVYPESGIPASIVGESVTSGFTDWTILDWKAVKLIPRKPVSYRLDITRPYGAQPLFTLPVKYTVSGDGWSFKFTENYGYNRLQINDFLVMGPFKNESGEDLDTKVYPPEIELDVTKPLETVNGKTKWLEVTAGDNGNIDLSAVLKNTDLTTVHAVAIVRAKKTIRINIAAPKNTSNRLFINGKRIGSSARRDAPRCVELKKGDNLFHLISSHKSGRWPFGFSATVLSQVLPGDIELLHGKELFASPLLRPVGIKIPEGKSLPNSLGIDWKLIYHDEFNRMRLGDDWTCEAVSYKPQTAKIINGEMRADASDATLTFNHDISLPVRIDFDLRASKYFAGVFLSKKGMTRRSYWYGPNGCGEGTGYYMALGWHNARNNRILKDDKTVVLDEKSPMLKDGELYHITGIFAPPLSQIYVNDKLVMQYKDSNFITNLDRIGIFQFGEMTFDNIRIYTGSR